MTLLPSNMQLFYIFSCISLLALPDVINAFFSMNTHFIRTHTFIHWLLYNVRNIAIFTLSLKTKSQNCNWHEHNRNLFKIKSRITVPNITNINAKHAPLLVAPQAPKVTFARQYIGHIRCSHAIHRRTGGDRRRAARQLCVQRVATAADSKTRGQATRCAGRRHQNRVVLCGFAHASAANAVAVNATTAAVACITRILLKTIPISHEHYL